MSVYNITSRSLCSLFAIFLCAFCFAFRHEQISSPLYSGESLVKGWLITNLSESYVHRFFDSSPFSPCGQYLALTKFTQERVHDSADLATVVVVDLVSGKRHFVATTHGWGAQVGAHVQWGGDSDHVYFNDILSGPVKSIVGVKLNWRNGQRITYAGGFYQINQMGTHAAAPDIAQIRHTQLGYGVGGHHWPSMNASTQWTSNGLFITDLSTQRRELLVSYERFAALLGITSPIPMFGFHTKWSHDGSMVLFVLRTRTKDSSHSNVHIPFIASAGRRMLRCGKKSRQQHLFAVEFAHPEHVVHVVSWDSCGITSVDGNHPDWVPMSSLVSMNLRVQHDDIHMTMMMHSHMTGGSAGSPAKSVWDIVHFDVGRMMSDLKQRKLSVFDESEPFVNYNTRRVATYATTVYQHGSGHVSFMPGSQYALTDSYGKETEELSRMCSVSSLTDCALTTGVVPLRLIDTIAKKEIWLSKVMMSMMDVMAVT